ncbi:hypothetical protein ACIBQX_44730 [Nonomuraea sp. NPDC049714]|uniref:hypothetical protein n=1 Tax=Nonomuraea sp. NPDC049714 TaxID=3364357 RepID=UPI0037A4641C
MKAQAVRTGRRMAPMADQAKLVANRRMEDARYWAAPRLENAAHRVEDQLAPKVSYVLTAAADKVNPARPRSRRWPMFTLMTGLALGAVGYMFYRRNAQQWTEHMKESASDASRWAGEKSDRTMETTDQAGATTMSSAADEASRKMS